MKRTIAALCATLLVLLTVPAAFAATDFKALLKQVDALNDFGKTDYSSVYSIATEKPGEKPSNQQFQVYRRDELDQFVMIVLKPEENYGKGYLKIGEKIWFYDRKSGNSKDFTIKDTIEGTNAKNSDIKKYTFADDYDIEKSDEGAMGAFKVWILTLKARNNEVPYQKIRLFIRKDKPIPLKEEDFAVSGGRLRTVLYIPNYITSGEKMIPSEIRITEEGGNVEGPAVVLGKSTITISDLVVKKLPDSTFTKAFLGAAQ
jgi:outer membrane lipoprotein-sorting protein